MIDPQTIPQGDHEIFVSTSFFESLPEPDQVREDAAQRVRGDDPTWRFEVMLYPERDLVVKFGDDITVAEGQCLWFMSHHLQAEVPVPAIFGWTKDQDETFLYTEYVHGDTLASRWDTLSNAERLSICSSLKQSVTALRQLQQPTVPFCLGQIAGQPLRDVIFEGARRYPAGPFSSIAAFNDWLARLTCRKRPALFDRRDPEFDGLTDKERVVFTHADLNKVNILISKQKDGAPKVVAILDWHQSGWYPEDWEFLKARRSTYLYAPWVSEWLPAFLDLPNEKFEYAFEYISHGIG